MSKFQKILELAWVPKPFYSNLEWAMAKALVNNPALQDNLPMIDHVLDDLEMTQHRVDRNKINSLADAGTTDGGLCFVREGKKYIWDGHHRYLAARKLGRMTCSMKTFELTDRNTLDADAYEGMPVEAMASQLRCRVGTLLRAMDSSDRRVFEMSKFGELSKSGAIKEANYDNDNSEFDRKSVEDILKQYSVIDGAMKELRVRYKQDDYKAVMSILKRVKGTVEKFEENVRGMSNTGGFMAR